MQHEMAAEKSKSSVPLELQEKNAHVKDETNMKLFGWKKSVIAYSVTGNINGSYLAEFHINKQIDILI